MTEFLWYNASFLMVGLLAYLIEFKLTKEVRRGEIACLGRLILITKMAIYTKTILIVFRSVWHLV